MVDDDTRRILKGIQDYHSLSTKPVNYVIKAGIDTTLENLAKEGEYPESVCSQSRSNCPLLQGV
jgi:hypothetical protein